MQMTWEKTVHHVRTRQDLTAGQNKGLCPQSWIHQRCKAETQTAHGNIRPPECKTK